MHVVSDSTYVVDGLTKHLHNWERDGWIGVANAPVIKEVVALLRSRSAVTTFRWVKGHAKTKGNNEADRLAGAGALLERQLRPVHLPPPQKYSVEGAYLPTLTQKLAYKGIRGWKPAGERRATVRVTEQVLAALRDAAGLTPTPSALWTLLRSHVIAKKVRDFLWKVLHDSLRIGNYWTNIPGYEDRATCSACGVVETSDHILSECSAAGQGAAWRAAAALLRGRGLEILPITRAHTHGGHAYTVTDENGDLCPGATRLARIVLTETAYLVWVLRCERVIGRAGQGEDRVTDDMVRARWLWTINKRFCMDRALMSKARAGRMHVPPETVVDTWTGTLKNESKLPTDWIDIPEVLVGMPPTD
ncbi:uncharacterized protein TRAVEDRAFT_113688 [Trametes versicolor FP-101664 SS1]|uniref:uncharacterized protein n=1 Tax=Trametes versicolor (strain FP-101664) TaxID=717944 RepID=UPI00046230FC|nr:uncharacterized protein TRAVEDRAFT_113688 [Trametes versicolor FP-101664 SS1]EIW62459.1 hypothetical protein TRAVEDRAFT_113688 [Trametes versicolor FP-101664 SS1]